MGSVIPIAFQALEAFQTIGTVANVVGRGAKFFDNSDEKSSRQALEHLQQQQSVNERLAAERVTLDKQEIQTQATRAEQERRQALKRAVARRRAEFGASGVGVNDGSSEAVLLGLFEESDDVRADRERLDNIRLQTIDQGLLGQQRVNTLQRTQLAEKERLKNSTSTLDTLSDLFSIF